MRFTDKMRIAAAAKCTAKIPKTNVLLDSQKISDGHNVPSKECLHSNVNTMQNYEDSKSNIMLFG